MLWFGSAAEPCTLFVLAAAYECFLLLLHVCWCGLHTTSAAQTIMLIPAIWDTYLGHHFPRFGRIVASWAADTTPLYRMQAAF